MFRPAQPHRLVVQSKSGHGKASQEESSDETGDHVISVAELLYPLLLLALDQLDCPAPLRLGWFPFLDVESPTWNFAISTAESQCKSWQVMSSLQDEKWRTNWGQ